MNRRSILIVEDSPIEASIYRKLLGDQYTLEFTHNGESAIKAIDKNTYELIITDVNLPGISGPEMINTIREHHKYQKTAIVVISSDQLGIEQALTAGANAWLLKPISLKTFPRSMNTIFKRNDNKSLPVKTIH